MQVVWQTHLCTLRFKCLCRLHSYFWSNDALSGSARSLRQRHRLYAPVLYGLNKKKTNQNQSKSKQKCQHKRKQRRLIRLIGVVFSNGTMLSVSDTSDSINECTQEINSKVELHIPEVWQHCPCIFQATG